MRYCNIAMAFEPKEIGVRNGVYQVVLDEKGYDKQTLKELDSLFISNKFTADQVYPEVDFKFRFKKLKTAKKTDFMSFTPNLKHAKFLVRNETLELLSTFKLQRFLAYETEIYDSHSDNLDHSYKLFYSVLQDWNVIDFEKTVFTYGGYGNIPKTEHRFVDVDEYMNFHKKILDVKTLGLNDEFDRSLDYFHTRLGGVFVSERLKNALEENDVTGIYFKNKIEVIM